MVWSRRFVYKLCLFHCMDCLKPSKCACFAPWKPKFESKSLHVGYLVDVVVQEKRLKWSRS